MKYFFVILIILSAFTFAYADVCGFIDIIAVKPANTQSYFGTIGPSLFMEFRDMADVKGLSVRPGIGIGLGTGSIERRVGLVDQDSDALYLTVIPEASVLYYIHQLKDAVKKGFLFYAGAGLSMQFNYLDFTNTDWDSEFSNSFPFPLLKAGMEYNNKLLIDFTLGSPSKLSVGLRF